MIAKATHLALTRILKDKGDAREALQSFLEKHAPKRRAKAPSVVAREAKEKQERLIKKGATADVRAVVAVRAGGQCEFCCAMFIAGSLSWHDEMDHFYGRARSESVETCWMLCGRCHNDKTTNNPTRAEWDERFKLFCARWRYPFRPRFTKELTRPSVEGPETPLGTSTEEPVR